MIDDARISTQTCNIGAQVTRHRQWGNGGYTMALCPYNNLATGLFTTKCKRCFDIPASYPSEYDVYVQDSKVVPLVITITVDEDPLPTVTGFSICYQTSVPPTETSNILYRTGTGVAH